MKKKISSGAPFRWFFPQNCFILTFCIDGSQKRIRSPFFSSLHSSIMSNYFWLFFVAIPPWASKALCVLVEKLGPALLADFFLLWTLPEENSRLRSQEQLACYVKQVVHCLTCSSTLRVVLCNLRCIMSSMVFDPLTEDMAKTWAAGGRHMPLSYFHTCVRIAHSLNKFLSKKALWAHEHGNADFVEG